MDSCVKIISWTVYLFKNIDPELRGLMWTNSPNHMIGNHINCAHFPLNENYYNFKEKCVNFLKKRKFL